ncbi:glycoside hydrolase [Hyphococcus sp.]|uniref:glycoside hydrolase n=1 Tax=Hyphococcus sp. TaxID=2038636 RepID=UPI0035C73A06
MSLSIFGLAVLAVCGYLLFTRGPLSLLVAVMLFTLMGGSAAMILTSLGGASVRPSLLAMVILSAAVCLPGARRAALLPTAIVQNFPLVVFCAYGALSAFLLPLIFAGDFQVVPMNPRGLTSRFDTALLHFTNQNITTAFYMLATMMAALSAWIAVQQPSAPRVLVMTIVAIAVTHAGLGVADLFLSGTPFEAFLEFFRNANYAQHNQAIDGFTRINGIFPEPSAYAAFALPWFVCSFELWLRDVWPRATGASAAMLLPLLVLSLSSTALVSLAAYVFIFLLRGVLQPAMFRPKLIVAAAGGSIAGLLAVLTLFMTNPDLAQSFLDVIRKLTVEKSASDSGEQRLFWALQGIDFFMSTWGIGIGAGSFRSSSIATAIMGSTGVIGVVTFVWFLVSVLKPFAISTYHAVEDFRSNVGSALAWGAFSVFLPALVSGASPDPGIIFGMISGASLGLRSS